MTSQSDITEVGECQRGWIPSPRDDLETDMPRGRRTFIRTRASFRVRRPREDLSSDVCPYTWATVSQRATTALKEKARRFEVLGHPIELNVELARGHLACQAGKRQRGCPRDPCKQLVVDRLLWRTLLPRSDLEAGITRGRGRFIRIRDLCGVRKGREDLSSGLLRGRPRTDLHQERKSSQTFQWQRNVLASRPREDLVPSKGLDQGKVDERRHGCIVSWTGEVL